MVTAIGIITALVVLLLVGLVVSMIAKRFALPDALFLILAGMLMSVAAKYGMGSVEFPDVFLNAMALLALALVVFEGAAKIRMRQLDRYATRAVPLTVAFLGVELVVFSLAAMVVLDISLGSAIFFAALVAGSSSDIMTTMFTSVKYKVIEILKFESILNTPIVVIIPFILLDVLESIQAGGFGVLDVVQPFILKIVAGVGSGALLFILVYKVLNRKYSKVYTPLAVIVSALLAFVLAENIGGDGVLSVTTLGLLFGNFAKKKKGEIVIIESIFSKALYVLIFILIGMVIKTPTSSIFWVQSGVLFVIYMLIRLSVVFVMFNSAEYSRREKLFASLQSTKGIATATLVLTFAVIGANIQALDMVLNLTLVFILYSLLVSTISIKLEPWFFKHAKNNS